MRSIENFESKKEEVKKYLKDFKMLVEKLKDVGLDVDGDILKLDSAIKTVDEDILSIALVGAVSDGKTTAIAGWLEEVKDNMKIATEESSDEILIYHPNNLQNKCQIVDTPGLFGDKEKSENNKTVKLSDITKKYISSAHIIFYVVDAANPLKDSHKEAVKWILRDLNKLDSTVFIINKMDDAANLKDEEDFNNQKNIKTNIVIERLKSYINLTDGEVERLNIVCISADPQERGLNFWLQHKEDYISRSRINELQNITNKILENSIADNLISKTSFDIIRDTIKNKIIESQNQLKYIELNSNERKGELKRIENDLSMSMREIAKCRADFRDELNNYENEILSKINSSSPDTIGNIIEIDIGNSKDDFGYKIRNKVESMSERYFNRTTQIVINLAKNIENHINKSDKFIGDMSLKFAEAAAKSLEGVSKMPIGVIKESIFAIREVLGKFGMVIKFKPWGTVKLAGSISKYSGLVGAAITVLLKVTEKVHESKVEEDFKNLKKDLSDTIKGMFINIYDTLRDDNTFIKNYTPQILELEKSIDNLKNNIELWENQNKKINEWKKEATDKLSQYKIIDIDFEVME